MTKKQRHEAYKKALKMLQDESGIYINYGICNACNDAGFTRLIFSKEYMQEVAPELKLFDPRGIEQDGAYWFPLTKKGYEQREIVLLFCIEMTR